MTWQDAAKMLKETPTGRSLSKIWIRADVFPLFAAIGTASTVCGLFMLRYFSTHSDVQLARSVRMSPEVGQEPGRIDRHNHHLGLMDLNKKEFSIFPFRYTPQSKMIARSTEDSRSH